MIISCIRCTRGGTSVLTYDHAGAEAYLDDARGDEEPYEGMVLCEAHASRFTPPRGWSLVDRRRRDPSLFGSSEVG